MTAARNKVALPENMFTTFFCKNMKENVLSCTEIRTGFGWIIGTQ